MVDIMIVHKLKYDVTSLLTEDVEYTLQSLD